MAVVPNQGLQAIAFFEATACLTLLVLFIQLKRDNATAFYKLWLLGWVCLTLSSFSELAMLFSMKFVFRLTVSGADMAALVLFLASIVELTSTSNRSFWPALWLAGLLALTTRYYESKGTGLTDWRWGTAVLQSANRLTAGRLLWRGTPCARRARVQI